MQSDNGDAGSTRAPTQEIPELASTSTPQPLAGRLGLTVPHEWWPSAPLLKSFEAAGFALAQVDAPPPSVLADARPMSRHAKAQREALEAIGIGTVVHGPGSLLAGTPAADRVFEGLLAYASEIGAEYVVYHGHALADEPESQDRLLAETRSLARLAVRAERLGVTIAVENLAPVYPGPELLSHTPMTLRGLVHRVSSPNLGICLDLGHAHIAADLKHTTLEHFVRGVLDSVVLFHAHDNLGARRGGEAPAGLDPLRLDLHLPPGRGTLPWARLAPRIADHWAPIVLEIHPPNRPAAEELYRSSVSELAGELAVAA